jgi:hypothetical protein
VHSYHPDLLSGRVTNPDTGVWRYVRATPLEGTCTGTVTVPAHARQLIAAHLHARRARFFLPPPQGATTARLSVQNKRGARPPSAQFLRERGLTLVQLDPALGAPLVRCRPVSPS